LNKNYIFHYRSGSSPVTIAFTLSEGVDQVYWDAAFCSDVDQFSKKTGRDIAVARLKKRIAFNRQFTLRLEVPINIRKLRYEIVDILKNHPDCPKSFKK